jgi:hypothetical protein
MRLIVVRASYGLHGEKSTIEDKKRIAIFAKKLSEIIEPRSSIIIPTADYALGSAYIISINLDAIIRKPLTNYIYRNNQILKEIQSFENIFDNIILVTHEERPNFPAFFAKNNLNIDLKYSNELKLNKWSALIYDSDNANLTQAL